MTTLRAGIPLESRRRPCLPARPRPPLLPARPRPPLIRPPESDPAFRAGQQVEARREMVLSALRTVFTMHNEECSLTDLQTQLRASHPHQTFERHEIDAILAQLEEENVLMYREGQILRI